MLADEKRDQRLLGPEQTLDFRRGHRGGLGQRCILGKVFGDATADGCELLDDAVELCAQGPPDIGRCSAFLQRLRELLVDRLPAVQQVLTVANELAQRIIRCSQASRHLRDGCRRRRLAVVLRAQKRLARNRSIRPCLLQLPRGRGRSNRYPSQQRANLVIEPVADEDARTGTPGVEQGNDPLQVGLGLRGPAGLQIDLDNPAQSRGNPHAVLRRLLGDGDGFLECGLGLGEALGGQVLTTDAREGVADIDALGPELLGGREARFCKLLGLRRTVLHARSSGERLVQVRQRDIVGLATTPALLCRLEGSAQHRLGTGRITESQPDIAEHAHGIIGCAMLECHYVLEVLDRSAEDRLGLGQPAGLGVGLAEEAENSERAPSSWRQMLPHRTQAHA